MDAHPNAPEAPVVPPDVAAAEDRIAGDVVAGHAAAVLEYVQPKWIFGLRQRRILERAASLLVEGREVDLVTLCEGQDRDAVAYTSTIVGASYGGLDLKSLSQRVRRDYRRREVVAIGRELTNGASANVDAINDAATRLLDLTEDDGGQNLRISNLSMTGRDLLTRDIAPLKPIVGSSLIVEGGMTLIVGHSGLGKTFLALQLMRAVAEGTPWLDTYWTDPNGRRVGLLELEMPEASIRARIAGVSGDWVDEASFLCAPDMVVDLIRRETQDEIIAWIRAHRLAMIVMDPVNSLHTLDENKAVDMAKFMAACKRIKAKTGVHIVLLHHVNKGQQDVKTIEATPRTVVLNMVRGSGRLGNDPDNVIGLLEAPGGRTRLVFAKTRHSASPPDPYLRRGDHGYFELAEAIQTERAHESNDKIMKYLSERHTPASLSEIAKGAQLSETATKNRIVSLGDMIESTQGRPRRYAIRTSALIDQCEMPTVSETGVNDDPFA